MSQVESSDPLSRPTGLPFGEAVARVRTELDAEAEVQRRLSGVVDRVRNG